MHLITMCFIACERKNLLANVSLVPRRLGEPGSEAKTMFCAGQLTDKLPVPLHLSIKRKEQGVAMGNQNTQSPWCIVCTTKLFGYFGAVMWLQAFLG